MGIVHEKIGGSRLVAAIRRYDGLRGIVHIQYADSIEMGINIRDDLDITNEDSV